MNTTKVTEHAMADLREIFAQQGINVPIYRVEHTDDAILLYLYGHAEPYRVPKTKPKPARKKAGSP